MLIRRAGEADIEPALAVMSEAFGFPLRAPTVHTLVAGLPDGHLFVALDGDRVVGTAASVGFGRTGWLGGVTVAPSGRGAGLGRRLTEAALAALGPRETLLLLATDAGRPIYERLGFVGESRYRVFMASRDGEHAAFAPAAPAAARALDARVTGEDRSAVVDVAQAVSLGSSVALRPPWAALPVVAPDPGEGEALVRGLVRPGMRLAVPEQNARAVSVLGSLGVEGESVLRMRLGPAVAWRPEAVWGVFSLFFG